MGGSSPAQQTTPHTKYVLVFCFYGVNLPLSRTLRSNVAGQQSTPHKKYPPALFRCKPALLRKSRSDYSENTQPPIQRYNPLPDFQSSEYFFSPKTFWELKLERL